MSDPGRRISGQELEGVWQRARRKDGLGTKIAKALELIQQQLEELGEEHVAISFNGGKDCTVLLHLYAAALWARRHSQAGPETRDPSSSNTAPDSGPNGHGHGHGYGGPSGRHELELSHSLPNGDLSLAKGSGLSGSREVYASWHLDSGGNAPVDGPTQPPPPLPTDSSSSSSRPSSITQADDQPERTPLHSTATHHQPTASTSSSLYPPIRSIYITAPNPFPTLETFVLDSARRYGLDLYRFGGGMKAALTEYLDCGGGKGVKGILVGTRRGDPNGNVDELAPTDPNWPQFLRIHPILCWTYSDVWAFLRELGLSWCELYNQGYTSLGSTKNTVRNPLLKRDDGTYDPAWMLHDESQERAGRLDGS